jgi:DNA-binding protein HU-beta
MNKADIIDKIHSVLGCTRIDAERAMETMISSISTTIRDGGEVSIAGLGIFLASVRKGRTGRNPRTGETITIPSMRVPKFKPAKALKEVVK